SREGPMIRNGAQQLRIELLPRVREIIGIVRRQVVPAVGTQPSVIPLFVVRHHRIEGGGPQRLRPSVSHAKTQTARETTLYRPLQGVVIGVTDKIVTIDGVQSGV